MPKKSVPGWRIMLYYNGLAIFFPCLTERRCWILDLNHALLAEISNEHSPMFSKFNSFFASGSLALVVFLSSCGSESPKEEKQNLDSNTAAGINQASQAAEQLMAGLPRFSEIPNLISRTGAEYEPKLLNPVSSAEKVSGNSSKAAFNIGMYGADVAYMAVYDQTREALHTFLASKKLADKVGIIQAFDQVLVDRLEKNLVNRDSLLAIAETSLGHSSSLLKSNQQQKEAALLAAGAFIEGLYLNCAMIHDYPPTGLPKAEQDKILVPLVKSVINQEKSLRNLIELLGSVNNGDEVITSLIADLEKARGIYEKADWTRKIADNKGELIPTEKDIHELAVVVSALRNGMIQ